MDVYMVKPIFKRLHWSSAVTKYVEKNIVFSIGILNKFLHGKMSKHIEQYNKCISNILTLIAS